MSGSINRVIILGNLGSDPELSYTASQAAVCSMRIATTEHRTSPNGEKREFTEWHRVVVWGKMAENCAKYLTKGRTVAVEGQLRTRRWDDKQGVTHYSTEVIASNVQFVGSNSNSGHGAGGFTSRGQQPANKPDSADFGSDDLDDIPF